MITRRATLAGAAALPAAVSFGARAADTPGVTATEIKIGNTMPYSGPASSYSSVGKADAAFFQWLNEQGGVAGRKINFISLDDGYSPPRTVEQTRRLVEQDQVAFVFDALGTPTNSAVQRYLNQRRVPQLFVNTGADKWADPEHFPWTIGFLPSYRTEAQIYAKHMLRENPNARLAVLYQNDDFGKDYPAGVRDVLGRDWDKRVVRAITYEVTDPTIDSQVADLHASGADTLLVAAVPKFAAQAIRKVHDLGWKPLFFMTNVSISVGSVLRPAGPENAVGMISGQFCKDAADPAWDDDAGMRQFKAFMAKYLSSADITDGLYVWGYAVSYLLWKVLERCNGGFSRENVMRQATNLKNLELPVLLPGVTVNTSPTDYHTIRAMQLARWDGRSWVRFGEVIEGVAT
ncbi:MAG: ABC transporter substrate-binding protein [Solirubrobacterales bacterium]|nr:ABC transporter substrate-binding protein [Solirubrobacterales bacterium]